jgi:hypothetical protein
MAGQATVNSGEFARGGLTRGDHRASEHDRGGQEQDGPCGMVEEASGALPSTCGRSYNTRDCIGETSEATWEAMAEQEQAETSLLQMTMDNGPESSGRRTPLLSRMVPLTDRINQPMPLLDSPPYPST